MDAEVLFAAMVAGPVFWRNIAHDEVYKAVIRGYNDWLGEEYCSVAPDRLIGMGVIPITNVDDAIAEMKHCKKLGLKGVLLGGLPNGKGYPTPEDDRFWAAALDLDMPITVHVQLYRTGARANQPTMQIPEGRPGGDGAAAPAVPRMAGQFRIAAVGRHGATGAVRRVRALPEAEGVLRRDAARLGPVLARAHGSLVQAPPQLGRGHARLQAAEGTAGHLRPREHLFHRAVRAGRGRDAAPCRRRPHHVRHRLPAYRERMAELAPDHRRDLRERPGRREGTRCGPATPSNTSSWTRRRTGGSQVSPSPLPGGEGWGESLPRT